uniref:Iporin-like n=1 Tax=Poecilia formosa TaxID=48698 RepID=A0A096LV69_POEFO
MIGASTLPGHALLACHFPVVQLPTWQLPVQALCSSAKRPSRLCSSGLTRAVSLPEQDTLSREHCFTGGRRPFSSSYSSLREDRVEEEGTSDSSGRYDSNSSPEETGSNSKEESCRAATTQRSHNSFLPNPDLDEDEEDEDSDGDNLHRYREDSSFVLHGNSNWSLSNGGSDALLHEDLDSEWMNEGFMLGMGRNQHWLSNQMDSLQSGCPGCAVSRSGIALLSCLEQDSDRLRENIFKEHKCSPELLSNVHTEDVSDSSCNSSDGVLVNFCTIYNKSNNPATPQDLSSPAVDPCRSSEGSVFLNLQPVPQQAQREEAEPTPSGLDSNCNLYSQEPAAPGLSVLEVADLVACIRSQDTLAMGTNQKYYKLVTCDLSSQSPSPAWSSLTSCLEGPDRSGTILAPLDSKKEGPPKENMEASDHQVATTSTAPCRKQHLQGTQSFSHMPCSLCGSQRSPHSSKCQETGAESTQPSVIQERDYNDVDATDTGVCDEEMGRCSKPRRPTSLPIQPFVLLPTEKPQCQPPLLGGLLDQYLNQKSSKPASSPNGLKSKEKRSRCLSELQPSPVESLCPIFLEAASNSDTCSTCTPSPKCFGRRHMWSPKSQRASREANLKPMAESQESSSLNSATTNNQPNVVRIPVCQDRITLQPEPNQVTSGSKNTNEDPKKTAFHSKPSHITPGKPDSSLRASLSPPQTSQPQRMLQQHQPLIAAARLSSLSTFLPSDLHPKQKDEPERLGPKPAKSQHSQSLILNRRPPAEFCLSPDTSYESMSISHLQRKGLLRAVSGAVDLIMAHFGSSRDPEEKMRLGNSSYSPTIAGLVLEHLCPAIQNILEDGLRDHKLDFIIGQRRNHSWSVVEISTTMGPSTKVLHSLVSKIKRCSELTSHCMRLRAFLMGLLNLRALEFWLSHLQSQKVTDVVTAYYHTWGFLFTSLSRCQPLFQELLLLLQPLSVLPFDLNLLLEPRLLSQRQLCPEERDALPPQPCSALLVTSWPKLQANRKSENGRRNSQSHRREQEFLRSQSSSCCKQDYGATQNNRNPLSASLSNKPDFVQSVAKAVNVSLDHRSTTLFQTNADGRESEREVEKDRRSQNATASVQEDSPCQSGLRWAKLFGAAGVSSRAEKRSQPHTEAQKRRRPSQWLQLDRSQIGLLAQSIRSIKLGPPQTGLGAEN